MNRDAMTARGGQGVVPVSTYAPHWLQNKWAFKDRR